MKIRSYAGALLLGTILSSQAAFAETEEERDSRGVIVVTGERPIDISSAGTKSATPIVETPQSISIVSSHEIARLGLQNLNQVLRFVAGVTTEQRGSSAEVYDQFKLRGFDAMQYLDGLRSFDSPSGYAAAQIDMSRLDRVEIVKGPASALYGQSGPGGLVALSSKLPLDEDNYSAISGTYGTYNLYRMDADIGGKLKSDIGWRIYGSANGADTQQRFGKRERQTISGAVTLGQGSGTNFTLLANYSHDPYNGTYAGFPAFGTFFDNPNGRISSKFDPGEPDNRFKREQALGTYIFNHDFGDGWHFRSAGRYQYVRTRLGLVYTTGGEPIDSEQTSYPRASYATREGLNAWMFDNQLTGTVQTGPLTHHLMFGVDRQVLHSTETFGFGSFSPINAYSPVYGTQPVPQTPVDVPDASGGQSDYHVRQQGIYVQDEISWGGLRVALSGRQDWARVEPIGSDAERSKKFTWRAGALYKTDFGLAPYVSYATSFQPQSGLVRNDDGSFGQAKPSLGKQWEVGVKYAVPETPILLTAAWFDIDQTNLLTSVPNTNYSIQTGKVNSKGIEVEATVPLPYDFQAKLAFSRQSVKDSEGQRVLGVGRGGATFDLEWAPQQGSLAGFALGGTVRHVDHIYAGTYFDGQQYNNPAYTLFDALMRYDLGKAVPRLEGLTLSVNATNIFDKKYLSNCYLDYGWCWYGNRRTVQATIGYRW